MLENFVYKKMEVSLRALENCMLPVYHGSMLRGVIGQTLRRVSCTLKGGECTECRYFTVCPYTNVFYCVDKNCGDMLTKVETLPNPFVIYPLMNGITDFKKDDVLKFNLTLFGRAITYIHYFIHSIYEIENMGLGAGHRKFELICISDVDTGKKVADGRTVFYNNLEGNNLKLERQNLKTGIQNLKQLTFVFDTPLRITDSGRLTENITFHLLLRNILRRLAMLSEFFMNGKLEIEHGEILERSREIRTSGINMEWKRMERYSSRVDRKLSMGGMTGWIRFRGGLSEYYPYIFAGQLTHIGKGCTMGLGHYTIRCGQDSSA